MRARRAVGAGVSILLVGIRGEMGDALVSRLIAQDDEVRVIEGDEGSAARWRSLGAHVAAGHGDDADLIERAAQGVRTVVLLDDGVEIVRSVLEGASAARVGRLVLCCTRPGEDTLAVIARAGIDYMVLRVPDARRRPWGRRTPAIRPDLVAEAIDAADDLAGERKLDLDLGEAAAWQALGLRSPS
jgi:hypothetical protein